ncbi:MAG: Hsp70 family protein [Acidobacteriaceae bacterium]|nr:Hsp70 family protein [Acidobacteriaceae bacterium]
MTGVGFDFGTTNSSIAVARPDGSVEMARFAYSAGTTEAYRSLLYMEKIRAGTRLTMASWSGPSGIERYLAAEEKGRLIQSLKSFLSSRNLKSTEVFGKQRTLEELISLIIRDIRTEAERVFREPLQSVVVGRPVRFVGSDKPEDDKYAQSRLEQALRAAGFEQIRFEYEPVGAAYHYESTLDRDQLLLIGDFGGGTSDFSLIRVGPGVRKRGRRPEDLLANDGVGVAGDSFDARIVRHLVSPALGDGTLLRSGEKLLPVPTWVYRKLERWHYLSLLRGKETIDMLQSVKAQACEPERVAALLYLIQNDLGYRLHQSVQRTKCALSGASQAQFFFDDGDAYIDATISRTDFERWIAPELSAIEKCVDRILNTAGVSARAVDRVFLTGGSSFVPAVRQIFESRFGKDRISDGNEFTSVARGLALSGLVN